MDISLEMIKRIISSDELCDKVNSTEYRESYIKQIESYIISLCDNSSSVMSNIVYINRYLRKFVCNSKSVGDIFFNYVLLKVYSYSIKNNEFDKILESFNFAAVRESIIEKYDQIISSNSFNSVDDLSKMLIFYCYACPKYVMPLSHINYFTYYLVFYNVVLNYDLICYFYKMFSMCFSLSKNLSVNFVVYDMVYKIDTHSGKGNKIIIYKQNIGDRVDYKVLADIFYQIKYLYLVNGISSNDCYSFEQLMLVKEICLNNIFGYSYFNSNYGDISFSSDLRKLSRNTVKDYFQYLKLNVLIDLDYDNIYVSNDIDDSTDKCINIDMLFDVILKGENPNLLKEFIKSYPILGCEYRNDKRKSLLNLLLDIYRNRKLLINLNKDLEWHKKKFNVCGEDIYLSKIERLNKKINTCVSYIDVMGMIINYGSMTSSDLLRSISDLITYDTNDLNVQNDIYFVLGRVVPRMIKQLCFDRNFLYREQLKKRVIKCYLDSMGLVRNNFDSVYFMRVYSTLELCIKSFDVD